MVFPTHRSRTNSVYVIMYSVGLITCFTLSARISKEVITWKFFYGIFAVVSIIDALVFAIYMKEHISPSYMIKHDKDEDLKTVLNIYLNPISAEAMFKEAKDLQQAMTVKSVKKANAEKKFAFGEKAAKKKNFFQKYRPELIKSVLIAVIFNLCFFNVFGLYSIFLITKDMSNASEVATSSFYLSIGSIVDLIVKLIGASFNLVKYRKRSMVVGLVGFGLVQLLNGYFQLNDMWEWSKIIPILAFPTVGGIALNAYFPWMAEFFSGKMVGIANANNLTIWIIYGLILPNLDPKKDNNSSIHWFSFTFGIGSILAAIGIHIFSYETYGKSRAYFYKKLRGLDTGSPKKVVIKDEEKTAVKNNR